MADLAILQRVAASTDITGKTTRSGHAELFCFVLIIALHLLPVWCFTYFPSQDGPSHLFNAGVLVEYHRADREILRQYYQINHHLEPNVMGHWLLATLLAILPAGTGNVAEKVLVSLYIITLPLAALYAVRAINRQWTGAFLFFPLIFNLALHKGLYNFCLSLSLYFLTIGFWIRRREILRPLHAVPLMLLLLVTYLCHLVSFLMLAISLAGIEAGLAVVELLWRSPVRSLTAKAIWRGVARRTAVALLAALPALILTQRFFQRQAGSPVQHFPFAELRGFLLAARVLRSYRPDELWLALAFSGMLALFGVLAIRLCVMRPHNKECTPDSDRSAARWHVLLPLLVVILVIFFRTPNAAAGGTLISHRLTLYVYFVLILWLASRPWPRVAQHAIRIAPVVLSLAMLIGYARTYNQMNGLLKDYMSVAAVVEPNSTILPVYMPDSDRGYLPGQGNLSEMIRPFLHMSSRIAHQRTAVDLGDYEASLAYFPVMYRQELDPDLLLDPEHTQLPDLTQYSRKTAGRGTMDYVLVWDMHDPKSQGTYQSFHQSLDEHYQLVATSPMGFARLYRSKEKP